MTHPAAITVRLMKIRFIIASVLVFILFAGSKAQDVNIGASTVHDENIFDVHTPLSDQITNFELNVSKDWDFDESYINLGYSGAFLLFRDLPQRTYHLHTLSLETTFHFTREEDEEESSDEESSSEEDSADAHQSVTAHSDSLDRFLYLRAVGTSQFNKSDFSQFDNTLAAAEATLRQPLGLLASVRPSYRFGYHTFPNLTGISYFENNFSAGLGTSAIPNGWITVTPGVGVKKYISSNFTYTYSVGGSNQSGHGKGGAGGGQRTRTIDLNTPSVRQFFITFAWTQNVSPATVLKAAYSYLDAPSTVARLLPEQVNTGVDQRGIGDGLAALNSQNEIFDDHYGYSGNQAILNIQQTAPFAIILTAAFAFQHKKYTLSVQEFDSTAANLGIRLDDRSESVLNISRTFPLSQGKSLKPQVEVTFIRNGSNVAYYDFSKTTFLVGAEFNF